MSLLQISSIAKEQGTFLVVKCSSIKLCCNTNPAKSIGAVQGLIAVMLDLSYGMVDFFSEEPYIEAFNKAGLEYKIIPRKEISAPYADYLRETHPEFLDEL